MEKTTKSSDFILFFPAKLASILFLWFLIARPMASDRPANPPPAFILD